MQLRAGIEFIEENPALVLDHLRSLKRETILVSPERLHFTDSENDIILEVFDEGFGQYPLRQSCLDKLLKWFLVPFRLTKNLSQETIATMLNDLLFSIRSRNVLVKIEDGDALTIASDRFTDLPDLELLEILKPAGLKSISRNDYMMAAKGNFTFEISPFPGDTFGAGLCVLNSETGFRSFEITNYLLRYVCSNGCYVKSSYNREKIVHYKKDPMEMINAIHKGGDEMRNEIMMIGERILKINRKLEDNDFEKFLADIKKILGRREFERFLEIHNAGTGYEAFNALTNYSKRFEMYRRIKLEEYAGSMISQN